MTNEDSPGWNTPFTRSGKRDVATWRQGERPVDHNARRPFLRVHAIGVDPAKRGAIGEVRANSGLEEGFWQLGEIHRQAEGRSIGLARLRRSRFRSDLFA